MAEFVAHEVEVRFSAAGQGEQADHLVQGNGAVDYRVVAVLVHVGVHIRPGQTEDHRLVAHQRLVVGLHIGHGFLSGAAQAHAAPHLIDVPEFVLDLHRLDPHIRQSHAQPVIKADAAVRNGQAHAGHTGHILGNGDGLGVHLTDQLVGKLQIGHRIRIGVVGEILAVGGKVRSEGMVMVQHGGHAVEAEAVEMVLRHPEFQVGQQEVDNAGLAVVKALCPPGGMVALGAVVEELPSGAVKHIDAFGGIFDGVGMHYVQQHPNAHGMCLVHQVFQFLRPSEPGGSGKEIAHLIAEGAVIGMLHNGHQLHSIVARLVDAGQDMIGKFPVGADLALLLRHAHVGFVDIQLVLAHEILIRPGKDLPVVHHLALEGDGLLVLHHPAGIQRDVLRAGQIGVHHGFDLAAVPQGIVPGEIQLPAAVA